MPNNTNKPLLSSVHTACPGCGQIIAVKAVLNALGSDIIIVNATGCLEVTTAAYPQTAWQVPFIHSLFANPASVASGVAAALAQAKNKHTKVVVQAGDGSTFDIGFGAISGMWARADDVLYLCYDNEAYSNTGMQASGATPYGSNTTTTPATASVAGEVVAKKDLIALALAGGLKYVAQTTIGYADDLTEKINRAKAVKGPSYIQILAPCIPGWKIAVKDTVNLARLAIDTGLYPSLEYIDGKLTKVKKIPRPQIKVEEYLALQGRFKHLFTEKTHAKAIAYIQKLADENIKKYSL